MLIKILLMMVVIVLFIVLFSLINNCMDIKDFINMGKKVNPLVYLYLLGKIVLILICGWVILILI